MTLYGYESRNIATKGKFKEILETRINAKREGNKKLAEALKLVINTTYGAMLNQHNDLYDPLMGRSVCITGQLFLLELASRLHKEVPTLKIIQLNTDGIAIEFDDSYIEKVEEIIDEWQERTKFTLEDSEVQILIQKDVNNYIEVQTDGSVKKKGGSLVRGLSTAGAFNINNNAVAITKAIENYLIKKTPIEETIANTNETLDYQIIAKASSKYSKVVHDIKGEAIEVQKVNRVYATNDKRYGSLYKIHAIRQNLNLIPNLPKHCLIDNKNEVNMNDIDKDWYIKEAKRIADAFINSKESRKKKMTEVQEKTQEKTSRKGTAKTVNKTTSQDENLNVYEKLNKARLMFLNEQIVKSGISDYYDYFELSDIVPVATQIFDKVGLTHVFTFEENSIAFYISNSNNPEESIRIAVPYILFDASKTKLMNDIQALGATITYMRRYLYMIALDICEADQFDGRITEKEEVVEKPKFIPQNQVKVRSNAKQKLANENNLADPALVEVLTDWMDKLKNEKPELEDTINELYIKSEKFTKMTVEDVEDNIERAKELLGVETV